MNAPNFASALDKPATEIEKPKPLPPGEYLFILSQRHREDKSAKKGTPFVEWLPKFVQPMDTVDAEALEEALTRKDGSKKALQDMTTRLTFYITEDSTWRLVEFLKDTLGIDDEGKTTRQMCDEALNRSFVGTMTHRPSEDGTRVFAELTKTAPAE